MAKRRGAAAILIAFSLVRCLETPPEAEHCPEGPVADSNEGGPTGDDTSIDIPAGSSASLSEGLRLEASGGEVRVTESSEPAPVGVRHFTPVLSIEPLGGSSEVLVDASGVAAKSCQPIAVFSRTDAEWTQALDGIVSVDADPVQVVVARACDVGAVYCDGECVWLWADETCLGCSEGCEADTLCLAGACDGARAPGAAIRAVAAGEGFAVGAVAAALVRVSADGTSEELATFTATEPAAVLDGDSVVFADGTSPAMAIRRVAAPGATPEDLVTGRPSVDGLASDGTAVYWAENPSSGGATIARAPLAGGPVEVVTDVTGDAARVLAVDEGLVVFETSDAYWSVPADGGTPTELAPVVGIAETVSGGFLYFASDEAFTIERVPVGGGEAELLNEGYAATTALAVYEDVLYWVESETESWPSRPLGLRHRLYTLGEEGATELRRLAGTGWSGLVLDSGGAYLGSEQGLEILPL